MLGLPFGTKGDRADRLEETLKIVTSLWSEPTTTFSGKHYQLKDAIAEPKPVQRPHPPIWIGGSGPKRTLRLAAEYADVWNAAGGEPEAVAESSAILDQHCADIGRDPAQIRRSVQIRVGDDTDAALRSVEEFAKIGVTEPLLVLNGPTSSPAPRRWPNCCRGCARSAPSDRRGPAASTGSAPVARSTTTRRRPTPGRWSRAPPTPARTTIPRR
jgi:alkanesulfonate monooxygenase SsuD/methylene tetrahydromethanopterin reductase-like flavin-dependent oxidoreductase (luciferase family)